MNFVDVTQALTEQGYADSKRVVAAGGSAGPFLRSSERPFYSLQQQQQQQQQQVMRASKM